LACSRQSGRSPGRGEAPSPGDPVAATFPWTRNHDIQGVKWEENPNLARWFNAITERPAVKAAIAKIDAIESNRDTASEDQKDRFFNRGRYARA
jgi:GST-like protein